MKKSYARKKGILKNWLCRKALLDLEEKKLIFNFLSDAAYRPFSKTFLCQFFIQYTLGCGQIFMKKSRNGDTLGPVELIVWPEQGNQGDWREQDG